MAESYQEIFEGLSKEGAAFLLRHGEDVTTSESGGHEFAERVMTILAKQQIYFPSFKLESVQSKNLAIREELIQSHESVSLVAQKHGITKVQAYNILKATQDLSRAKSQGHEAIRVVAIEAARMLIKHGVPTSDAAEASRGFAAVLCARWRGRFIYFPANASGQTRKRSQEIWAQHQQGVSTEDIAKHFGVSIASAQSAIRMHSLKESGETPRAMSRRAALRVLQKRILEVAKPYTEKDKEVSSLLHLAADFVAKAREEVKRSGLAL